MSGDDPFEGVPARVFIRRNADGEVHCYYDEKDPMTWDGDFIWEDGNYACDCNRALFFAWAVGDDDPEQGCGDEAFSIRVETKNGLLLYEDDNWNINAADGMAKLERKK